MARGPRSHWLGVDGQYQGVIGLCAQVQFKLALEDEGSRCLLRSYCIIICICYRAGPCRVAAHPPGSIAALWSCPTVILLLQMAKQVGSSLRCQVPPACPLVFDVVSSLLSAVAYGASSTRVLSPGMALKLWLWAASGGHRVVG